MHYITILGSLLLPVLVKSASREAESYGQGHLFYNDGSTSGAWDVQAYPVDGGWKTMQNATATNASIAVTINKGYCVLKYWCGEYIEGNLTPIDDIPSYHQHSFPGNGKDGTVDSEKIFVCDYRTGMSVLHATAWCCWGTTYGDVKDTDTCPSKQGTPRRG